MTCCQAVNLPHGATGIVCKGDPEARWIARMAADYEKEVERVVFENQPLEISDLCDECGRVMFEDEPGVLECLCGERLRAGEVAR